ncbi:DUF7224 domain-containing protein [Kitasatospora paracochleata]|uniref:Uncharacterized protein n=2 Tax=Kitasatospora paracochleata TaxID=58354 RepID=A0ABT1J9D2_9ACTN|nr:hypothetical protein [Kitasatospora paracochleata]MCP2313316.1 hypothetical protein [Kitasatospora paracochleata]
MTDQVAVGSKPRWQVEVPLLAATTLYGLVAYAAGTLVAAAVTVRQAGPGFLWPGYLLLGAGVVVLCASVGHLVGRWFPSGIAVPVIAGLSCFVALAAVGGPGALGFFVLSGAPYITVVPGALVARLVLAAAVAALAVFVPRPTGPVFRGASRILALCSVAVVLLAVVGVRAAGPVRELRAAPSSQLCTGTTPKICVWPEQRKYLPQFEAMANRAAALPAELIKSPASFHEQGLRGGGERDGDFSISEGSMWEAAVGIGMVIGNASEPRACEGANPAASEQRFQAMFEIDSWITARIAGGGQPADRHGGPPGVDQAEIARLVTTPEAHQIEWVKQRMQAIGDIHCA